MKKMMGKNGKKISVAALAVLVLLTSACSGRDKHGLSPKNPTVITIWHYYNGAQKENFDLLAQKFNETEGLKRGIVVEAFSKGSINELEQSIRDSIEGKVGSEKTPNAYAAYADTAYQVDHLGVAVDLSQYWTEEEQEEYVDAYIEEGRFDSSGSIKLFPIAKSTELFALNRTDWDKFAQETGADTDAFSTWEGIAETAESYYNWTDSMTEIPDDGKAFFGRDAFANYMIIGSKQLGHEIFSFRDGKMVLDFDKTAMKRLWDNYYIPYVNGYYGSYGKFRSDDVKTGDLLAFVGSSSGVTYFPTSVTKENGTTYEIDSAVYPLPNFKETEPYAVQQGAGMMVLKSDETKEYAAVEFLKWFTKEENNLLFSAESGYLPVKIKANDKSKLDAVLDHKGEDIPEILRKCLHNGLDTVNGYHLYTSKPFEGGKTARTILNDSMDQKAAEDREEIVKLMTAGMSRKDALSQFMTEENFDQWFENTKRELMAVGE